MKKSVLFINRKKSMVANALVSGLEGAGFSVVQVQPNVTEISRVLAENEEDTALSDGDGADSSGGIKIWLLYLQEFDYALSGVLPYIKDQVNENNVRFFVIGTNEELDDFSGNFPITSLKEKFLRPFRADDVIARLTKEYATVQKIAEVKRILIVDDDATMLRTMKDMLSDKYRVYTANSGMNAIQLLVNTEVDLILLDYEMPVIKGPQVLQMIRSESHTQKIPVMFLTSKNDRDSIMQVMSLNPANYLLKSLPQAEIMAKIKEFFDTQQL